MAQFEVFSLKIVDKQLNQIHPNDKKKAFKFFNKLLNSSIPGGVDVTKMSGAEDSYRTKVGKLRIIYTVIQEEKRIIITRVKYRKSVYRN